MIDREFDVLFEGIVLISTNIAVLSGSFLPKEDTSVVGFTKSRLRHVQSRQSNSVPGDVEMRQ